MSNWKISHNVVANSQGLYGAEYSGSQMGSPDYAMKFKGCMGCYAYLSESTDTRVSIEYLYNPNRLNYGLSVGNGYVSFSVSGSGTAYKASKLYDYISY